jgi:hypothetical protein
MFRLQMRLHIGVLNMVSASGRGMGYDVVLPNCEKTLIIKHLYGSGCVKAFAGKKVTRAFALLLFVLLYLLQDQS